MKCFSCCNPQQSNEVELQSVTPTTSSGIRNLTQDKDQRGEMVIVSQPATASRYQPATASRYQPARASRYQPARASRYQPARASRYQPATASRYQPARASRYQPATASRYQPARASRYQPATASRYQPATASLSHLDPVDQYLDYVNTRNPTACCHVRHWLKCCCIGSGENLLDYLQLEMEDLLAHLPNTQSALASLSPGQQQEYLRLTREQQETATCCHSLCPNLYGNPAGDPDGGAERLQLLSAAIKYLSAEETARQNKNYDKKEKEREREEMKRLLREAKNLQKEAEKLLTQEELDKFLQITSKMSTAETSATCAVLLERAKSMI